MDRDRLYADGPWVKPLGHDTIAVENPATETIFGHVPAGTAADVDRAVVAARTAFPRWADTPPAERAAHLDRLHTALAARTDTIAETITREVGTPIKVARRVQAGLPLTVLRSYADLAG